MADTATPTIVGVYLIENGSTTGTFIDLKGHRYQLIIDGEPATVVSIQYLIEDRFTRLLDSPPNAPTYVAINATAGNIKLIVSGEFFGHMKDEHEQLYQLVVDGKNAIVDCVELEFRGGSDSQVSEEPEVSSVTTTSKSRRASESKGKGKGKSNDNANANINNKDTALDGEIDKMDIDSEKPNQKEEVAEPRNALQKLVVKSAKPSDAPANPEAANHEGNEGQQQVNEQKQVPQKASPLTPTPTPSPPNPVANSFVNGLTRSWDTAESAAMVAAKIVYPGRGRKHLKIVQRYTPQGKFPRTRDSLNSQWCRVSKNRGGTGNPNAVLRALLDEDEQIGGTSVRRVINDLKVPGFETDPSDDLPAL